MRAILAICSGLVLVLLVAPGCADSDEELRAALRTERARDLSTVTRREVANEPPGSPSRAVLELWRAVQYRDARTGIARLTPAPLRKHRATFEKFFVYAGANAFGMLKPRIVDVQRRGRIAVVETEIMRTKRLGRLLERERTATVGFEFVNVGGVWKLRWRPALSALAGGGE
jgi:hypothetical protein